MLFVSSTPLCPTVDYELLDNSGNAWNNDKITMTNPGVPLQTSLVVKNFASFSYDIKIKGYSMTKNTIMNLKVRVCGAETLTLASTDR